MRFIKEKIDTLSKCYSIAPLCGNKTWRFLVAAEKHDPCYLYDEEGNRLETVWTAPGGVMTMVQVPGNEDQFLATHKFYSPNDSAEAKIVIATRKAMNDWDIRTLVEAPFVHRFGLLSRNGKNYLIVCCLKSGHECREDWSKPGKTFFAELPSDLSQFSESYQLKLELLKEEMGHNHGYSYYCDNGVDTAIISCDSGVFQFIPPERENSTWEIKQLYDQAVSDAVLVDFDGDGVPELGCIAPFHGDQLYICRKNNTGEYEKAWDFGEPCEMLHSTWPCTLSGKPAWIVGYRKGKRDLMVLTFENGTYKTELIDSDCGSANVFKFVDSNGSEKIISANRETDEVAMYTVRG